MKKMINIGIDLGTTNSLIAKSTQGKVEVFKNPKGHKEGLPSVIAFRKDKILIGDKAREFINKDPNNVASRFKRKMGTTETIKIKSLQSSKTPEELSAYILKELKTFVHSQKDISSAVITIPAAFDTIQSNATKEAGIQAGIKEVVLLQEPIAASLAYANKNNSDDLTNSQWLVYDLGGGTFDVALIKIIDGELTVVDHAGDNYFGGTDLDSMIIEKLVIPVLEAKGSFTNLLQEMQSATGKHEKSWFKLLLQAEEAKIELSTDTSAEIEYDITDDNGKPLEGIINITRSQFKELIKERITATTLMIKQMLTKNSLQPKDIKFTLMVGGSTFIPFVRTQVEEMLGIPVNTSIDPTNAIVAGAAYYASSKPVCINTNSKPSDKANSPIKIKASYQHNSQEDEELFAAKITGETQGMTYRISRTDGGFDTGIKQLTAKIQEDLPLIASEYNIFTFDIFNTEGNKITHNYEQIQISQGLYSVTGQPLPNDLYLIKDDPNNKNSTVLDCIAQKNCILPITRVKRTVEVARTVYAGNNDTSNKISIIIVEGEHEHYLANKLIGTLEITGSMIPQDLLAGEDIYLTFAISESRDVTISADLTRLNKTFTQVFNPKKRKVIPTKLVEDIDNLETMIVDIQNSKHSDNYLNKQLETVRTKVVTLQQQTAKLTDDAVTDEKFQLEDQKRQLASEAHNLISQQHLESAKNKYLEINSEVSNNVKVNGNSHEHEILQEIISKEEYFLKPPNIKGIKAAILQLEKLHFQILKRNPDVIQRVFLYLIENKRASMINKSEADQLISQGKQYLENSDWQNLSIINSRLWDLVPDTEDKDAAIKMITGIV